MLAKDSGKQGDLVGVVLQTSTAKSIIKNKMNQVLSSATTKILPTHDVFGTPLLRPHGAIDLVGG